jgi:large subunit ribosomal protein L3
LSIGLIGNKSGMTRLFLEDGESVPVTAVSVCGNFVADIKTASNDGYTSLVVSKTKKSNNINKSKSVIKHNCRAWFTLGYGSFYYFRSFFFC